MVFSVCMIRNKSLDFQLSIDINGILIRFIYRVLLTFKLGYLIMKDPVQASCMVIPELCLSGMFSGCPLKYISVFVSSFKWLSFLLIDICVWLSLWPIQILYNGDNTSEALKSQIGIWTPDKERPWLPVTDTWCLRLCRFMHIPSKEWL